MTGFCAADYQELISTLLAMGYRPCRLEELVPGKPLLFLRHDVDLCLERALAMAEMEGRLGVRSTYYVLVSTTLYNPASVASRGIMRRMVALGHSIGLHFDASLYGGERADLETAAERECAVLESLCDERIESISFHRPAADLIGMPDRFAGRRHAYEPQFFSDVGYVSDSNGGWHHGHPLDHPSIAAHDAIQLLTHPIWWTSEDPADRIERVEGLRLEKDGKRREDLAATIKAYRDWLVRGSGSG